MVTWLDKNLNQIVIWITLIACVMAFVNVSYAIFLAIILVIILLYDLEKKVKRITLTLEED